MNNHGSGSNGRNFSPNADGKFYKHKLMVLQENAPRPRVVECRRPLSRRPPFYRDEFHGMIDRTEADALLSAAGEGAYLVRESQRAADMYTLCLRFNNETKNYRLYFDGFHYVGEKRFDTLEDLVADGLICMYMDLHAKDYIDKMDEEVNYEETPYWKYQQKMKQMQRQDGDSRLANNRSPAPAVVQRRPTAESERTPPQVTAPRPMSMWAPASSSAPALEQRVSPSSRLSDAADTRPLLSAQQKAHVFKPATFKASFCDLCGNFLWGLVKQGVKCADCGFVAHKKCSERTRNDCQPVLKFVKQVFAVNLATLCMARGTNVPPIVMQCVSEVESRGLFVEGIYRVSGSHEDMERLRNAFDMACVSSSTPKQVDLSPAKIEDIHTIAGLLKLYFRLLPQPLVPTVTYQKMAKALRQKSKPAVQLEAPEVCRLINDMPEYNRETLRVLARHLALVAGHSAVNKMSADNLAVVFAPTIMSSAGDEAMHYMPQHEPQILHYIIEHVNQLFDVSPSQPIYD